MKLPLPAPRALLPDTFFVGFRVGKVLLQTSLGDFE